MKKIKLMINGDEVDAEINPRTSLADFLREKCRLTSIHLGCEHGVCGACSVLLDDHPIRSCIMLAVACEGSEVHTLEGLDDDPMIVILRDAFHEKHGLQCGYCTPGMLITARDILKRIENPDERSIRQELSGNICRCTGYVGIIRAVERAAEAIKDKGLEIP
jgi:carbon-monoxide dehydrogenase small subunit